VQRRRDHWGTPTNGSDRRVEGKRSAKWGGAGRTRRRDHVASEQGEARITIRPTSQRTQNFEGEEGRSSVWEYTSDQLKRGKDFWRMIKGSGPHQGEKGKGWNEVETRRTH